MKCYFLLVFLYSVICQGTVLVGHQEKCESTTPIKIQDCSNLVDLPQHRCCYIEATKSNTPIKGCKFIPEDIYDDNDNLNQYAVIDKRWDDISFVKCDPYNSRSDSKYLKLGILSLLFLI